MKTITFERIMLCVIAAGVWTIAILCMQTQDVNVVNTVNTYTEIDDPIKVEVTNEVDVNIEDVLGGSLGTHKTYVDQYGIQHWGIDVIDY